jgi:hypothetical protein
MGEGVHQVRATVVDRAGRRAAVALSDPRVDLSAPVPTHRLLPPEPAANGLWRRGPQLVLRAVDGDRNSGVTKLEYRLGTTGAFVSYTGPLDVTSTKTVQYRATDAAGRTSPITTVVIPVDVAPPTAKALSPSPTIWLRTLALLGLGPAKAKLNYAIKDTQSTSLRVIVLVHDALGNSVRRIDGGWVPVTPGVEKTGFVEWDGTDQSLTGFLGVGLYYYRVVVSDLAGNWTESGESKPLQIKLL